MKEVDERRRDSAPLALARWVRSDMSAFESRFERLELKYLVDESTAARVRRDIQPFCSPDPHSAAASKLGRRGYGICSLYLDSPGLALFHAKERGDPEHMKLRIRSYGSASTAVVELKHRVADVIHKTRATVGPERLERVVRGGSPSRPTSRQGRHFLSRFARIVNEVGAQPTLAVRYEREAYTSVVDDYARVTFDRRIEVQRTDGWDLDATGPDWCEFDHYRRADQHDKSVVLELKCQSFVPAWITELVRTNALRRRSFSKYAIGIYLTGVLNGERSLPRRSARSLI